MTQQERDDILIGLKTSVGELQEHAKKTDKRLEKLETMEEKLDMTYNLTKRLSQQVATIEVEHGRKIQALLDVYADTINKNFESRGIIDDQKNLLENHEIRITHLEAKTKII